MGRVTKRKLRGNRSRRAGVLIPHGEDDHERRRESREMLERLVNCSDKGFSVPELESQGEGTDTERRGRGSRVLKREGM